MIEQWKQESKLVIQLLTPVEWNSRDYGPGEGNVLLTLGSINAGQKIRVYHIYCLSQPIPAHAADVKYRFIVSMDPWNGRDWDVWEKLDVRLDGKSIGTPRVAFKKLDDLPAKSGEHIKLELSSRLGEGTTGQVYRRSNFIHRWMAKGALVDLYENGKKLNSRIVTWKPFDWKKWIENGGLLKTMDDVTWVVDGKEIGDGKELLKYIAQWEEVKDTVIQVLEPSHSVHPKYFLPEDGIAYSKLQELSAQKRLRMFRITPDDVYYTGKPPTSQQ